MLFQPIQKKENSVMAIDRNLVNLAYPLSQCQDKYRLTEDNSCYDKGLISILTQQQFICHTIIKFNSDKFNSRSQKQLNLTIVPSKMD